MTITNDSLAPLHSGPARPGEVSHHGATGKRASSGRTRTGRRLRRVLGRVLNGRTELLSDGKRVTFSCSKDYIDVPVLLHFHVKVLQRLHAHLVDLRESGSIDDEVTNGVRRTLKQRHSGNRVRVAHTDATSFIASCMKRSQLTKSSGESNRRIAMCFSAFEPLKRRNNQ